MNFNENGQATGFSLRSSDDEIAFYKHKLVNSGRRRGAEGALVTAASMLAACADLFAFTLGEDGRATMMASLNDFFDRYPPQKHDASPSPSSEQTT